MNIRQLKPTVLATVPAIAVFLVIQACGSSDPAVAQEAVVVDPLEGVWEGPVTIRDCTTSAVLATFLGTQVFHRGGTMLDTNSVPTASRGPGFGTWVKSGSSYTVKFRLYVYDSTGVVSGIQRVTRTVTLAASGVSGTGTNTSQQFDLNGAVVRSGCSTDVVNRVL